MEIFYEPCSAWFGHAKPNVALLKLYQEILPDEKLVYFADRRHIEGIEFYNSFEDLQLRPIDFREAKVQASFSLKGFFATAWTILKILRLAKLNDCPRVTVLSLDAVQIFWFKVFLTYFFSRISIIATVHGNFEEISRKWVAPKVPKLQASDDPLLLAIAKKFRRLILRLRGRLSSFGQNLLRPVFDLKNLVEWDLSKDKIRYLTLSPHILQSLDKFIKTKALQFDYIWMPFDYRPTLPLPKNPAPIFGVFGFGDPYNLQLISQHLEKTCQGFGYKIKIIGTDHRGLHDLTNVELIGDGRFLHRSEMEKAVADVDFLLILFDKDRYQFGCSTSVFEAFSYSKPVVHLNSKMMATFNIRERAIGYSCDNIGDLSYKMEEIIKNYDTLLPEIEAFRNNIQGWRHLTVEDNRKKLTDILLQVQ